MTRILAIDPGNECSAWLLLSAAGQPDDFGYEPNDKVMDLLRGYARGRGQFGDATDTVLAIEQIASFGMAVGAEVFETVFWSGRFAQVWEEAGGRWDRLKRLPIKMHLCHDSRAKDPNIRQALLDRFGGKDAAVGNKKTPGPLYGISKDVWSALAVAVTYADQHADRHQPAELFAGEGAR